MNNTKFDRNRLLKRYHTICSISGLTAEDKEAILAGFGVESSTELSPAELMQVICKLEVQRNYGNNPRGFVGGQTEFDKLDRARKRAIAAIGGYLKKTGYWRQGIETIKEIACRATGHDYFNRIPIERLNNIYNTFRNKQKDSQSIEALLGDYNTPYIPQTNGLVN